MKAKTLNTNAKLLLISQAFSFLGDYCVLPAVLIIATYYESYWVVSGVLVVRSIPMVFQPFLGVLVDKIDRRKIMFWTDIGRGLAFIGVLFIPLGQYPLLFLFLLFVSYGMGVFFNPARLSLMSCLGSDVKRLNVIFAKATTVCIIFGASLGAVFLYFDYLKLAVLLNALSYLLSSFLVLFMKVDSPVIESIGLKNYLLNFKKGLQEIQHNIQIRNAIFLMMLMATFCGIVYSFYPVISESFYDGEIGNFLLTIALGVGGFLGAQLVSNVGHMKKSILYFTLATLVSILVVIHSGTFLISLGTVILFYMAMEFGEVIAKTFVHEHTPADIQGRIFAISEALIGLFLALGSTLINYTSRHTLLLVIILLLAAFYIHNIYATSKVRTQPADKKALSN
ncbi:Major Facilitator Superfamily protein [Evansella caseinilytica]|uniref:Major Facilitator Superfamily protein n=1 Tax=Evansella caseinilytica TaxID=1503961 RepID=A0A1H3G5R7_9BACI|nr:MFS transporter [Evansella caseinilytica]SDX97699.1 Major Facilitator Superfamily protein [Evansella caseinilytica]